MFKRTWRQGEITVVLLIVGAFTVLAACTISTSPLPPDERRAQSLDKSLICPICPGETIDRSQVLLANQMQVIVREQIEEGRSDSDIRQFFVDRYGERVLAAPPKEGFNLLMWIAPPVGVVLALLVLYFVTKSMLRPGSAPALRTSGAGDNADSELDAYLELVDKEMGEVDESTEQSDKNDTEGT
jgi:cytochrome c-type biogenesis protein CcmH|tara:strand:- start:332 stop:886 length:555 start_codon:yes stop_codon:yes gene_type:complete